MCATDVKIINGKLMKTEGEKDEMMEPGNTNGVTLHAPGHFIVEA